MGVTVDTVVAMEDIVMVVPFLMKLQMLKDKNSITEAMVDIVADTDTVAVTEDIVVATEDTAGVTVDTVVDTADTVDTADIMVDFTGTVDFTNFLSKKKRFCCFLVHCYPIQAFFLVILTTQDVTL